MRETGQSVPDAELLQRIAEVLEVSVSQLLGEEKEMEQRNEIAEQLSRINEQLAIKNRRSKRIWTIVGAVLGCWVLLQVLGGVLSYASFLNLTGNRVVTTMTVSEAVEVLEDEDGNILTITKIED